MKTKHTKGQWQVVDNYDKYEEYSPENPTMYIWDGDEQASKPICDMGEMGDMNYAQELANAKLIAAAPELLENLIRLVDRLEETGLGHLSAIRRAKECITKAIG